MISMFVRFSFWIGSPDAVMHSIRILQSRPETVTDGKAVSSVAVVSLVALVKFSTSELIDMLPTRSAWAGEVSPAGTGEMVTANRKGTLGAEPLNTTGGSPL